MLGELIAFVRRNGIRSIVSHVLEIYFGALLRWLPGIEGLLMRGWIYRLLMKRAGADLFVYPHVYIIFSHCMTVGKRVAINVGTYIDAGGGLDIGDNVMIAPHCTISTRDHSFKSTKTPMCFQPVRYGKITIGNDVWIGANVFIRRDVTIGDGSVIAAGTVVLSDVPPYAIFAGVPGRVLRYRQDTDDDAEKN